MDLKDRDLVMASKNADFSDPVYGQIVGFYEDQENYTQTQERTGEQYPSKDEMLKFTAYTVSYFAPGSLMPSFMITPFVKARAVADSVDVPEGFIRVAEHPLETKVMVSADADFAGAIEGALVYQDVTEDHSHNIFGVRHFSEAMGCDTVTYGKYAKLTEPTVSRSQLYGLITQLQNLIKNGGDTAAALRSVANLYSKPDEVLKELDALRGLIQHHG